MEQISPQSLSLKFDRVSGVLTATYTPMEGVPLPNLVLLKQALEDGKYTKLSIDDVAINYFLASTMSATETVSMKIGERRDGEYILEVSNDLMSAYLTLIPAQGGRAKAIEVLTDIRLRGIIHGILHDKLRAALKEGSCDKLLIAQGDEAVMGTPARFESLLDSGEDEEEIDDDAIINYADISHMLLTNVGDPVMRRIPTDHGTIGMNIKGEEVNPPPVAEVEFNKDCSGTELHPDDPNLLIAAIAGQPTLISNGVKINPVVIVDDIDLSTGNMEFSGTVKVKGDVKTGMRLCVTGDVFVQGTVEAAEIQAGGNITVNGGIIGMAESQPGGTAVSARLRSEGSVQALFAESAVIEARESIMIAGNARQCDMMAGNEIIVGKNNPKLGQIIGGKAQATQTVKAITLGSPTGNLTKIQVGHDPYLEEKLRDAEHSFQKKLDELDRIIKQIGYFKQHPEKSSPAQHEEIEHQRKIVAQEVKDLVAVQAEMKEELIAADSASVVVIKAVFEGVEIKIGRQTWPILSSLGGGTAHLQGGRIAFGGK